jgi:hypothetical protein
VSNATDMFVIIGDSDGPTGWISAEDIAPKVADIIRDVLYPDSDNSHRAVHMPVISCNRDDWQQLQGGHKVAGSACIWFAWNYARPEELEERLKAEGFRHVTVWSHHEFAGMDGIPPRVVSLGQPEPRMVYVPLPDQDAEADHEPRYAFTRAEDAHAYSVGADVLTLEVRDGPVKTRPWHKIFWVPPLEPHESCVEKDFDGRPGRVEYAWLRGDVGSPPRTALTVEGWDAQRVRKVYSEQRAQHIAKQDMGLTEETT